MQRTPKRDLNSAAVFPETSVRSNSCCYLKASFRPTAQKAELVEVQAPWPRARGGGGWSPCPWAPSAPCLPPGPRSQNWKGLKSHSSSSCLGRAFVNGFFKKSPAEAKTPSCHLAVAERGIKTSRKSNGKGRHERRRWEGMALRGGACSCLRRTGLCGRCGCRVVPVQSFSRV